MVDYFRNTLFRYNVCLVNRVAGNSSHSLISRPRSIYNVEVAEILPGIKVTTYCSLNGNLTVIGDPAPHSAIAPHESVHVRI